MPRMPRVAVVTDTTHYLPREVVRDGMGSTLVSLYVNWGDTRRRPRVRHAETSTRFYAHLRRRASCRRPRSRPSATSSQVYEPIVEAGDDIVSIHLSGGISGTVGAAGQARRR